MANRFPLVLDVDSGNKIKELPSGDNLNLRESSIVNVQDINALGTINAADITVNGNRLVAQTFADLTDTPNSFAGAANYFVKVKEDGTGLEFRPFSDIGNIEVERIDVSDVVLPTASNTVDIGSDAAFFRTVRAVQFRGDLVAIDNTKVFDSTTGKISYAALEGAPQFLSEFTDDIGFLRTSDLDDALGGLFDDGVPFATDIKGSVFADDSTVIVDGVAGVVRGDTEYTGTGFIRGQTVVILADGYVQLGQTELLSTLEPETAGEGSIGTEARRFGNAYFNNINSSVVQTESLETGLGLGIGSITSSTDISLSAGNRVKVDGAVPFRVSSTTDTDQAGIAPQSGDLIYNTTQSRLQIYQNGAWVALHSGTFTGNVTAATGQSDFNDVVIAGNLTVSGTTTTVDTANTTIKDNVITLNEGETGAGVTAGTSGIEIDRGSEANKTLVWDETDDKWTVGSEIFKASTFEAVAFSGSLLYNGGQNAPLQIFSGQNGQTGNTIFINPYGSDTYLINQAETYEWRTGPYLSTADPYIQFKTAGAFKALGGAYFEGNLTGDVVGSVFADDSTPLVDSVAGLIRGDLASTQWTADSYTNITVNGFLEIEPEFFQMNSQADGYMQFNAGDGEAVGGGYVQINAGDGGSGVLGTGGYVQINAGNGSGSNIGSGGYVRLRAGNSSATGTAPAGYVLIEGGSAQGGNISGGYVTITAGDSTGNSAGSYIQLTGGLAVDGTGGEVRIDGGTSVNGAGGDVVIEGGSGGNGTDGRVRISNAIITGNIDNINLTLGSTDATAITIGNSGSTTTIEGTIQFTNALIANNLTADDSIIIRTLGNTANEAITIRAFGTNNAVNLTADNIRFFGPITEPIDAVAGVTGDVKGSVFGDDSTVIVDAVNNHLIAEKVITPLIEGPSNAVGILGAIAALGSSHNITANAGPVTITSQGSTVYLTGTGGLYGIKYDDSTANIDLATTGTTTIQGLASAAINIGVGTSGTVTLGNGSNSIVLNGIVDFSSATVSGLDLTGDVKGSVFADDSSVMVDAVNFVMFSDALTLTPLNAEPENFIAGTMVAADGVSWDPASKAGAVPYPVFYDGVAWNALY